MFLWLVLLTNVNTIPVDEFKKYINEGDFGFDDEKFLMQIVPGNNNPSHKYDKVDEIQLSDIVDQNNEHYQLFMTYVEKGFTSKGLTFTIYDDNLKNAAVALFRLLQSVEIGELQRILAWARNNVNKDLLTYALKITAIYSDKNKLINAFEYEPPYITKPNYFINSETIRKAMQLMIDDGKFNAQEGEVNQFYKTGDVIAINTNYSGWNLASNGCHEELNYFREDIGINSYYSGIQLLHPFWMSNSELEEINPKHAEYYYYVHKQLMARYNLEKEYLKYERNKSTEKCFTDYNPYLQYDNGLPFPIRSSTLKDWNEEQARIKSIDIAIRECISRRVIFMDNGTKISMTEDNYIDLLAKILRANLDGVKSAKFIRSFFGYGGNTYPLDSYNPAPSVLHHPETSLRDPVYWYLIQNLLNYFNEFERTLEPYDISKYEYDDVKIIDARIPKITTYFSYYQLILNKGIKKIDPMKIPYAITARLKRLNHVNFDINFTVESKTESPVVVRLFLGPQCYDENCWVLFSNFFELDCFSYQLQNGINNIIWSTHERFSKFSYENYYNMEDQSNEINRYNLFKFPASLVIPKGLEIGLNLTLFVIISPKEEVFNIDMPNDYYVNYRKLMPDEFDRKPLGFPFHREGANFKPSANNYRFFNITVFHKKTNTNANGYFSKNLN
ncbi:Basic juvenile hormone-suppressible protein 2 [Papilio xuthus]|uniref:Basic juvenile hormone-suppressible protein 2 n=1 Tax=Papilio xuthus TaxID=66420 RepID=A0A194Q0V3_PAPXU|nr:Basic juvenile hormone-suppressible protein 2 [Papilio xuthus]